MVLEEKLEASIFGKCDETSNDYEDYNTVLDTQFFNHGIRTAFLHEQEYLHSTAQTNLTRTW